MDKYEKSLLISALLLVSFGFTAQAQQVCPPTGTIPTNAALLCWTNATQNVDGSAIPATGLLALKSTQIQRAMVAAAVTCDFTTITETLSVTPDVNKVYLENLPAGKHCFRARHYNNENTASAFSATVSKTSVAPALAKPKPLTITIY